MVVDRSFLRCYFCSRRFSPDLQAGEGQFLHSWKVAICIHCLNGNREGLPMDHPGIRRLIQQGLIQKPSERNVSWPDGAGQFQAKTLGESGSGFAPQNPADIDYKP